MEDPAAREEAARKHLEKVSPATPHESIAKQSPLNSRPLAANTCHNPSHRWSPTPRSSRTGGRSRQSPPATGTHELPLLQPRMPARRRRPICCRRTRSCLGKWTMPSALRTRSRWITGEERIGKRPTCDQMGRNGRRGICAVGTYAHGERTVHGMKLQ